MPEAPVILHYVHHAWPMQAGYTIRTHQVAVNQRRRGYTVGVARDLFHSPGETAEDGAACGTRIEHQGVPYLSPARADTRNPIQSLLARLGQVRGGRWLRTTLQLPGYAAWLADQMDGPCLLHVHSPHYTAVQAVTIARRLRIPVLYEIRGFWNLSLAADAGRIPNVSRAIAADIRAARKALHIVAICQGIADRLVQAGIPRGKISIVPNGVDTIHFKPIAKDPGLVSKLGLEGKFVFGYATNVRRMEGIQTVLDAWPSIRAAIPNAVFLLIGEGRYLPVLKRMAQQRALADDCRFIGCVPYNKMPVYYSALDVFVVPRISEPICDIVTPLKPLEAMAMGVPVIASDVAGLGEMIDDGRTGLLFRSEDADALATMCIRLANDPAQRKTLACTARAWVRRARDWNVVTSNYDEIYQRLLNAPSVNLGVRHVQ